MTPGSPDQDGKFALLLACGLYHDFHVLTQGRQEGHQASHREGPCTIARLRMSRET